MEKQGNVIENYYVKYVEWNGAYLQVKKNEEEAFRPDDFQDLQKKMIQSNNIPRLLPMSFENVNNETTIYYKIEGLRKLKATVKQYPLTMQDYYVFFINVIQALQDSNKNMLADHHFVLNEEYIYVGNGYYDVHLLYLPLKDMPEGVSIYEQLKSLLLNMASDVSELNGKQFRMILNYLKDPGFSLHGIKQLLSQLQHEYQDDNISDEKREQEEQYEVKQIKRLPPLKQKHKIYSVLMGVLLIAIVWKLYESFSNTLMLITSIVLSLVIVSGIVVYWFFWRPGVEPIITEKRVKRKDNKRSSQPSKQADVKEETQEEMYEETTFDQNDEIAATIAQKPVEEESNSGIYDETMLLDTIDDIKKQPMKQTINYLQVNRGEETEEIHLTENNFVIGRSEKRADYVENSVGISRVHIELIKLSNTYGIKDLGSKNGTFINQEKIIPYKVYELSNEDEITIGRTLYTYKIEYREE